MVSDRLHELQKPINDEGDEEEDEEPLPKTGKAPRRTPCEVVPLRAPLSRLISFLVVRSQFAFETDRYFVRYNLPYCARFQHWWYRCGRSLR